MCISYSDTWGFCAVSGVPGLHRNLCFDWSLDQQVITAPDVPVTTGTIFISSRCAPVVSVPGYSHVPWFHDCSDGCIYQTSLLLFSHSSLSQQLLIWLEIEVSTGFNPSWSEVWTLSKSQTFSCFGISIHLSCGQLIPADLGMTNIDSLYLVALASEHPSYPQVFSQWTIWHVVPSQHLDTTLSSEEAFRKIQKSSRHIFFLSFRD